MSDQEWEELFDRYITEVIDDEQEHIKSHELPTAIKIRGLVSDYVTQAAANKAAEEGGLPIPLEAISRMVNEAIEAASKNGANSISIPDDYVAVAHFVCCPEQYIAADRASRQVANKAEVEPAPFAYVKFRAAQRITTGGDVDANEWYEFCEQGELGDDKLPAFPVYATPPATTGASTARDQAFEEAAAVCDKKYEARAASGHPREASAARNCASEIRALKGSVGASTVLTDERIEKMWDEAFGFMDLPPAAYTFAREVAAQAGQVTVPEDDAPCTSESNWIEAVILDVAELPDRDSPEEWPEAMLVTGDELRTLIALHAPAATLSPLCGAAHAESGTEEWTDERIEELFQAKGGRWQSGDEGGFWIVEDADLHPFVRTVIAQLGGGQEGSDRG